MTRQTRAIRQHLRDRNEQDDCRERYHLCDSKSKLFRTGAIVALAAVSVLILHSEDSRRAAAELYRQRKFAEAAVLLQQHLAREPQDSSSRLLLGLCYQLSGDLPRAESVFNESVRRRPDDAGARYSLARVLYLRGRLPAAEQQAAVALERGEAPARIHTLVGLIRVEQRQFDAALKEFRTAMDLAEGRFVEPFVEAGILLVKLNRAEEAVRVLDAALARVPESAEAARQKDRALQAVRVTAKRPAAGPGEAVRLRDVARPAGVTFVLENSATPEKHLIETMAGGVAIFDYDGDGLPDIFFTNGAALPAFDKSLPRYSNRMYRNLGGLRFQDATRHAGLAGRGYSMGTAAADFDNDGHVDLFVAGVRSNILYRNRGDGTFEDVTARAGVAKGEWSVAGAWVDYDRDGLLDLFVVNYLDWRPGKEPYCGDVAKNFRVYCHPRHFRGTANRLYRNTGGGAFEDVSNRSRIGMHVGKGMSAAIADADGDGFPDIFVTNDSVPNFLFQNSAGGKFEEVAVEFGVALTEDGKAVSGMGTDFRDYDNDGLPDIILTALAGETFPLFRNEGNGRFRDVTWASHLGRASSPWSGWSAGLVDLNNDGWKDLFSANSHVTDNIEVFSHDEYRQQNTIFASAGGSFHETVRVGTRRAHRGAAFGDLDIDGRLDIVVTALGEAAELWHNITPATANWLAVKLEGTQSNRDGIGAVVRAGEQTNVNTSAVGYASSSHGPVHFGLGHQKSVDLEVVWPSGCLQVVKAVTANQIVRVVEPAVGCAK